MKGFTKPYQVAMRDTHVALFNVLQNSSGMFFDFQLIFSTLFSFAPIIILCSNMNINVLHFCINPPSMSYQY
jgi:hypothetical protein